MITVYNSLSRSKAPLQPREGNKLGLYVCGMTVYDYCHLGHARVMVAFDVIVRYLRARGFEVNYVRNITDIDDKIIQRANEQGVTLTELTTRFIAHMHQDAAALGTLSPDQEPKATDHISHIVSLIQRLLANGHAYVTDSGDVYYRVSAFANYGALAHKDLDGLRVGARVAVSVDKADPLDFVLWKLAKAGEPSWESPWGQGRPGWHIECSAMSMHCLGEQFDLHGGGADLQFPHHENEIAQAEGATGKPFVTTWLHVGFVQIDKEKMSKSLGNFFTIRDILADYPAEVVRYFMISSHYRSPLNYSQQALDNAKAALTRFYQALRGLAEVEPVALESEYSQRFFAAMDDDFNTPVALAVLFELVREINRLREQHSQQAASLGSELKQLAAILGLLSQQAEAYFNVEVDGLTTTAIEALVAKRNQARADKDWHTADAVREQLASQGIVLEDAGGKTIWRRA